MKTTFDKKGQLIASDLMPLTPIEELENGLLSKVYKKANGNISLTAKTVGWSRWKTLKMLRKYKLYDLYPHEPGPFSKDK